MLTPCVACYSKGIDCAALKAIQAGRRKVASDLQTTSLERIPKTHGWSGIHEKTLVNRSNVLAHHRKR